MATAMAGPHGIPTGRGPSLHDMKSSNTYSRTNLMNRHILIDLRI
jgi:hypothetical protein